MFAQWNSNISETLITLYIYPTCASLLDNFRQHFLVSTVYVCHMLFILFLQYVVTGSTEDSESANQSVPFRPILLQTVAVSQPVTRLVWSGRGDEAVFATTEDTVSA